MTADLDALRARLVTPASHAGGDCQCACFEEGHDLGVAAVLALLEQVPPSWCVPHDGIVGNMPSAEDEGCEIVSLFRVKADQ